MPKPPIEAVIFDLDGVLVSTDEPHYLSWKRMADEEGIYFDREVNRGCLGVSRMESLEVVLRNSSRAYTPEQKQELADRKNAYYLELIDGMSPDDLLPGVAAMLAELKRRGVKLAVASGSRNAAHIVRLLGLEGVLDACVSRLDITRSKPDPEAFLLTAQRMGVAPERCLVVEDAPAGIEAARRAGMRALGIGRRPLEGAARTVADLSGITVADLLAL